MTVARQYIIHAKKGHEVELAIGLSRLAELVRKTAGCRGVDLLQDLGSPQRFVFRETWANEDAHKLASNPAAHACLMQIMPWYDRPPESAYFACLMAI